MFDVDGVRALYPALADCRAWLDGAAGTQVPEPVIEAVTGAYRSGLGNQGAVFATSSRLGELVERARAAVAVLAGVADPEQVVFGPSTTALVHRFAGALAATWRPGDEVVVTELDHEANLWPWARAAEAAGAVVRTAALDPATGTVPAAAVTGLLGDRTRLVAITAASNLLGTEPDVAAVAAAAREAGALTFVDGAHHLPHAVPDVPATGADLYVSSAYKWYGPHLATVVARPGVLDGLPVENLRPVRGGGPVRFELGTNPFPALAGVAAAVDHLADPVAARPGPATREALVAARTAAVAHEQALGRRLVAGLRGIASVRLLPGWDAGRRAPTAAFRVEGTTPLEVATALDRAGVNLWHGHAYAWACVGALGLRDDGGAVRASVNHYNHAGDVDRLLAAVSELAAP